MMQWDVVDWNEMVDGGKDYCFGSKVEQIEKIFGNVCQFLGLVEKNNVVWCQCLYVYGNKCQGEQV